MNKKRVILWFRNDLRLHDQEALYEAMAAAEEVYPVFVFDDRIMKGRTSYGFRKTGVYRTKFLLESIQNLQKNLRRLGSDLIIRSGYPEEEIFKLAKELKTSFVFCNRERTSEEVKVQDMLERNLWAIGQEVRYSRGKMLYYTSDLPFPVTHTPDIFTIFRKEVEKIVPIRAPIAPPVKLASVEGVYIGCVPTLNEFDFSEEEIKCATKTKFIGGEDAGLERLQYYLWDSNLVSTYKTTRNELVGMNYSSKFSLYLANGCLSPKIIFKELKQYEKSRIKNESTYHLFFELLWRDFFRLVAKKHGNAIFLKGGIKNEIRNDLKDDMSLFRIWSEARTGLPFIDASMRELNSTGYLSNRARQNVASFLVNDLHVNWQIGAEYFESLLIDYDPCSNWGNWNYIAGVGCDPREGRFFKVINQAKKYDPEGTFIKYWIPELKNIPIEKIHQPFLMTNEDQQEYNCILKKDYPQLCLNKTEYQ